MMALEHFVELYFVSQTRRYLIFWHHIVIRIRTLKRISKKLHRFHRKNQTDLEDGSETAFFLILLFLILLFPHYFLIFSSFSFFPRIYDDLFPKCHDFILKVRLFFLVVALILHLIISCRHGDKQRICHSSTNLWE